MVGKPVVVSRLLAKLMEIPGKERHSRDSQRLIKAKNNTDFCHVCRQTIEDQCIRYGDYRWHMACFKCRQCARPPNIAENDAVFNSASCTIHCLRCANVSPRDATPFEYITKLTQYSFLLRVALSRLCNLLQITGKEKENIACCAHFTYQRYYKNRQSTFICRLFYKTKTTNEQQHQHFKRCQCQQYSTLTLCRKTIDPIHARFRRCRYLPYRNH